MEPTSLMLLQDLQVLVVDDDRDTCELIQFVLEQYGANATLANSVDEALETLNKTAPDVLISDIGMPEKDGYSLISEVTALSAARGKSIPALALTAYARPEDRVAALTAGFQMHLSKPVEPEELAIAVASLVEWNH